ncbi:MAG: sterol desaturase family protein, partial [Polyangia bacterium]
VDRNYAGVLIIWDRLFGTFEPEGDEPVYGLVKPLGSFNPLWANTHRWFEIAAMSRRTRRLRDKIYAWFAPPEWRPADLGGPVVVPEPDRVGPSLVATPNRRRDRWSALVFAGVFGTAAWFIHAAAIEPAAPLVIVVGVTVLASVITLGAIYSQQRVR